MLGFGLSLLVAATPSTLTAQRLGVIVLDAESGRPLAATLHRIGPDLVTEQSWESREGRFTLDVPSDLTGHAVVASAPGYLSSQPHNLGDGLVAGQVLIWLSRLGSGLVVDTVGSVWAEPKQVMGRVTDAESGRALANVQVWLDSVPSALTDPDGRFRIGVAEAGEYSLRFTSLGFAETVRPMTFDSPADGVFLSVRMSTNPIGLDPIVVEVVPRARLMHVEAIAHRIKLGHGTFVTGDELKLRGYPTASTMVMNLRGIHMRRGTPVFRDAQSLGLGMCPPTLYVDGVKQMGGLQSIWQTPTLDFELVESYSGAATIPAEFAGSDARCGVIAIWTRRGNDISLNDLLGPGGG